MIISKIFNDRRDHLYHNVQFISAKQNCPHKKNLVFFKLGNQRGLKCYLFSFSFFFKEINIDSYVTGAEKSWEQKIATELI